MQQNARLDKLETLQVLQYHTDMLCGQSQQMQSRLKMKVSANAYLMEVDAFAWRNALPAWCSRTTT